MSKNFKKSTAKFLATIMLAATISPVFAQDYSSPYSGNYNNDYKQPVGQSYQTQQYNQSYQQQYSAQTPYQSQPAVQNVPNYQQNYSQNYNTVPVQNNYNLPPLQGSVVTVPAGTLISGATAATTISTERVTVGDTVTAYLAQPFYYAGNLVLPAGTNIQGNVVVAEKAGRAGKSGRLKVVFNSAIIPTGQRIAINGKFATEDGTGLLKGGTGKSRATKAIKETAVGAGAGSLLGLIFGAASGGDKGKGAAVGAAIGGGTGLAKTVVDKGQEVIIEAGKALDIVLDYPFTAGGNQPAAPPQQMAPLNAPNYNYSY